MERAKHMRVTIGMVLWVFNSFLQCKFVTQSVYNATF